MKQIFSRLSIIPIFALTLVTLSASDEIPFEKHTLDLGPCEAVTVAELNGGGRIQWRRHIIDYSTRADGGMQIPVVDIDGDGDLDIVVAGKSG